MYTLKVVTANLNEMIFPVDAIEWKRAEKAIYASESTGGQNKISLLPGDTAYLVNRDNRTVATYTNPVEQ
ncbi:Uncharacterised protein [Serratia ficaria]|nr:Uncharacterised protein [Serratia ficaria]